MADVILDGGLDLVSARPAALPGTIRRCLNYEVGWRRGLTRIDGFERFDGTQSPSSTTGWVFRVLDTDVTGDFFPFPPKPERLVWSRVDGGVPRAGDSGMVTNINNIGSPSYHEFFVTFRSAANRPQLGDTVTGEDTGAYFNMDDVYDLVELVDYHDFHRNYTAELALSYGYLRQLIKPVPGGGTIVGLHFHEDQLYAIRDTAQITLPTASVGRLVAGMYVYNDDDQVGEVVRVTADGTIANIRAVDADGFKLEAGDTVHVAATLRFSSGSGAFNKLDGVLGASSGWAGKVGIAELRTGVWESANAAGTVALIDGPDTNPTVTETINNTTVTGSFIVDDVMFSPEADAFIVDSVATESATATMWRSTDAGWEAAIAGRTLAFADGAIDPNAGTPVDTDSTTYTSSGAQSSSGGDVEDWANPTNIEGPTTGTAATCSPWFGTYLHQSDLLYATNFQAAIPDTATIRGIEVIVSASKAAGGSSSNMNCGLIGSINSQVKSLPDGAPGTIIYGSPTTTWGVTSVEQLNSEAFGFWFRCWTSNPTPKLSSVYTVQVKVYWSRVPGSDLYLYNTELGADIGQISITDSVVESGTWGGSPLAAGYFRLLDWTTVDIPLGTEIRDTAGGAGFVLADTAGSVSLPALPGSLLLSENKSKYQIISYNFFASEEQNAIYGVSGAGMAFWYDGVTLDFIPTGVDADVDKPRHIAPHENRLCLGYKWGEVYMSATDPLDFSADTGLAASFGFGDKITGLMPAAGKALGVFTESTTNVLTGAPLGWGEDPLQHVEQQVINHRVGAIEYTVQSMGERPIFASFRGIETLETMDQYSDFFTAPLTHKVSDWLLERLQTAAGVEATDKSVVNSIVVRNKNQYRLFFADGWLLTLTFVGPEKDPQCTTQQYWFNDDPEEYFRCYATASGTTTDGRDRVFASIEPRAVTPESAAPPTGDELDYAYELDRGRSFDHGWIHASFDLTYYFASAQQGQRGITSSKKYNCFQVHGTCAGDANLFMARTVNYEDLDDPVLPYEAIPFYDPNLPPQSEQSAKYTKGRFTARGFAVSIQISNYRESAAFPHTIQMISFLDEDELKQNR